MFPQERRRQDHELDADETGEDVERVIVPVQREVVDGMRIDDEFKDDQEVQDETELLTPNGIVVEIRHCSPFVIAVVR